MFVSLLFSFLGCSLKKTGNVSEKVAVDEGSVVNEKVILHHVSLVDIYTTVDVNCENFETAFAVYMKKDTITESDEIVLLETYMANLKEIDSLSVVSMDTRAKLYFISSLDTIEYCINSGIIYSNGVYYEISEELFDYIENLNK